MHQTIEFQNKWNQDRIDKTERQIQIIVRDFNTWLIAIDRPTRQKISKDKAELSTRIIQQGLISIYVTPSPLQQQNTHFFFKCHGTFTKTFMEHSYPGSKTKFQQI